MGRRLISRQPVAVHLDEDTYRRISSLAMKTGRSMSFYIRLMVYDTLPYLDKVYGPTSFNMMDKEELGEPDRRKSLSVLVDSSVKERLRRLSNKTATPMSYYLRVIYHDTLGYVEQVYGRDIVRHGKNLMRAGVANSRGTAQPMEDY